MATILDFIRNPLGYKGSPNAPKKSPVRDMMRTIGDSGTERYSGFFKEEPNPKFQDDQRVDIIEEMRRSDATVKALLSMIKAPMLSAKYNIETPDESREGMMIRDHVEERLFNMRTRTFREFWSEAATHLDFGFSVFEKIFGVVRGVPTIVDLEPRIQNSIYRWQLTDGRPGVVQQINSTDFDGHNNQPEIPIEKLVVFTNEKEGDDLTGQSLLRPVYKHWYYKDSLYRIAGIAAERYGVGIPVVYLPDGAGEEEQEEAKEMAGQLRSNEKSFMVFPNQQWKFEIATPSGSIKDTMIKNMADHHDRMILMAGLANFMNLGSESEGSHALSKDQSSFFLKHVEDKLQYMCEQMFKQVIRPMCYIAFRDLAMRKDEEGLLPKLTFEPIGDIDYKEMSEVMKALTEADLLHKNSKLYEFTHSLFKLPQITDKELAEIDEEVKKKKNQPEIPATENEKKPEPPKKEIKEGEIDDEEPEDIDEDDLASHHDSVFHAAEKKKPGFWRPLTLQEQRVDLTLLNEEFDKIGKGLEDELAQAMAPDIDRAVKRIGRLVDANDAAGIAAVSIINKGKVAGIVKNYIKESLEVGKKTASEELTIEVPPTPSTVTQSASIDSKIIADQIGIEIEVSAKSIAKQATLQNISQPALTAAVSREIKDVASKNILNVSAIIAGEYINRGRFIAFSKEAARIKAYQRSEILDSRTCNICMSLDQRIIKTDDPFAESGLIHSNCRGIWVPVFADEEPTGAFGIPKTVRDNFDTVGGFPTVNKFKQLKKPINRSNEQVQRELKRRLDEES